MYCPCGLLKTQPRNPSTPPSPPSLVPRTLAEPPTSKVTCSSLFIAIPCVIRKFFHSPLPILPPPKMRSSRPRPWWLKLITCVRIIRIASEADAGVRIGRKLAAKEKQGPGNDGGDPHFQRIREKRRVAKGYVI